MDRRESRKHHTDGSSSTNRHRTRISTSPPTRRDRPGRNKYIPAEESRKHRTERSSSTSRNRTPERRRGSRTRCDTHGRKKDIPTEESSKHHTERSSSTNRYRTPERRPLTIKCDRRGRNKFTPVEESRKQSTDRSSSTNRYKTPERRRGSSRGCDRHGRSKYIPTEESRKHRTERSSSTNRYRTSERRPSTTGCDRHGRSKHIPTEESRKHRPERSSTTTCERTKPSNLKSTHRPLLEITGHFSHGHELARKEYKAIYNCDGCKMDGFGARYRCSAGCDFDLHQECTFPKTRTEVKLFKNYTFKFCRRRPAADGCPIHCDACGKPVEGFVYHCEIAGWDLHPCCRNLEKKIFVDGAAFKLHKEELEHSKCVWCKHRRLRGSASGIRGWSYVSGCGEHHLHLYCAREMVLQRLERRTGGASGGSGHCHGGSSDDWKYWGGTFLKIGMLVVKIAPILLGEPCSTAVGLLSLLT